MADSYTIAILSSDNVLMRDTADLASLSPFIGKIIETGKELGIKNMRLEMPFKSSAIQKVIEWSKNVENHSAVIEDVPNDGESLTEYEKKFIEMPRDKINSVHKIATLLQIEQLIRLANVARFTFDDFLANMTAYVQHQAFRLFRLMQRLHFDVIRSALDFDNEEVLAGNGNVAQIVQWQDWQRHQAQRHEQPQELSPFRLPEVHQNSQLARMNMLANHLGIPQSRDALDRVALAVVLQPEEIEQFLQTLEKTSQNIRQMFHYLRRAQQANVNQENLNQENVNN